MATKTLTGCVKKAGAALREQDRDAILAAFNAAVEGGAKAADAARAAVDAQIAEVEKVIADMGDVPAEPAAAAQAAEQGGEAPTVAPTAAVAPMPGIPGISMSLAQSAHRGTSFSPERRGEQEVSGYRADLQGAWDRAARIAGKDEAAIARITEVFEDVAAGYSARYSASLGAKSQIMSTMITGGGNFPVRRMEKKNATARKRADEASEYLERGIKRLIRAARGPIDNSPESELERVRLNLTQREERQELMKAANAALRKKDDEALEDLGFTAEQIAEFKKPDFAGRTGFAAYELSNNNAEIARLRERLKSAEDRMAAAQAGPVETERPGVRMVEDATDDRLRLIFEGKPGEEVRAELKAAAFKWSPKNEAWQRQLTPAAKYAAKQVLDKHYPAEQTRTDDAGNVALFSRTPTPDTPAPDEANALKALAENDDLFALPKATADTVEGVAAEIDPKIQVKQMSRMGSRTDYMLTMPDGKTARLIVREPNPFGPDVYGFTTVDGENQDMQTERPGENPEDVEPTGDVWIDVSLLEPGSEGHKVYAIAAGYAHNTDRIFIGDPAGLSPDAMRRRSEAMLSSALRYGTTRHIAPHPEQVKGDPKIGVPPLKWVYGDDLGNIRRLVDLNVKALDNAFPDSAKVTFDVNTGKFRNAITGIVLDTGALQRRGLRVRQNGLRAAEQAAAGGRTIARGSVWRALLREGSREGAAGGRRDGLLGQLALLGAQQVPDLNRLFSRGAQTAETASPIIADAERVAFAIRDSWATKPPTVVIFGMQDAKVPQRVREADAEQRSQGAEGEPEGFYYRGTIYVNANVVQQPADILRVMAHEGLGHLGLRGAFGPALDGMLAEMSRLYKQDVLQAKAVEYGLANVDRDGKFVSYLSDKARLVAAEEVLASLAQSRPTSMWVQRAVSAIRKWLRENVAFFADLKMTDADLIAQFILPARNYVERGRAAERSDAVPAFQRGEPMDDALFSRPSSTPKKEQAERHLKFTGDIAAAAAEYIKDEGSLSAWSKTLGTPYNLAQRNPQFKVAFDAFQRHLSDVSDFANAAADLAPNILPRLDGLLDVFRGPLKAKDAEAIQRPIFDGTLLWTRDAAGRPLQVKDAEAKAGEMTPYDKAQQMLRDRRLDPRVLKMWQGKPEEWFDAVVEKKYAAEYLRPGIVWKPQELADIFKLTPAQVKLYQQFRRTIDRSLDDLATTSMIRVARDPSLRDVALSMGVSDAADYLRPIVEENARRDALKAGKDDAQADAAALEAGDKITNLADRVEQLKAEGYAPLMRFGSRFVKVIQDNEMVSFHLYETAMERSLDMNRLRRTFPGATFQQGTVPQEAYKAFEGVSPETLALFADVVGLTDDQEKSEAFQTYLREAISNRSAMKRLIQRKGVAGFREDVPRVLASFVTSNARASAANINTQPMLEAVQAINPPDDRNGQGELQDYAQNLYDFMRQPTEQWQAIRGLMFHWFLGGNISSAVVNMFQPFQTTFPELSKVVGVAKAKKYVLGAIASLPKKPTGAMADALKRAEREGKVSPQEFFHLISMARGAGHLRTGTGVVDKTVAMGSNGITRLAFLWGRPFAYAEQYNRRVTFTAGYNAAVDAGMADPYQYAVDLIDASQFVYNSANRPVWMRSVAGATLLTFQTYVLSMLEMMARNAKTPEGRRALAAMLVVMLLLAGIDGLPGIENLYDIIDGIMQRTFERNWHTKQQKDKAIRYLLGEMMSPEMANLMTQFIVKGVSGLAGVPLDVSGRFSMAKIAPGTGVFTLKENKAYDLMDILGPVGSFVQQQGEAAGMLASGDIKDAAIKALPVAGANFAKGIQMATTGQYRDTTDKNVLPVDKGDAAIKALGFQPSAVSKPRAVQRDVGRRGEIAEIVESSIVGQMARARRDNDEDARKAAQERLAKWNRNNPDTPIRITPQQVQQRLRNMTATSEERLLKRLPRELRRDAAEELRREAPEEVEQ